jgi:hypothetical protein
VATSVPVALKRQMSELAQRHAALPPEAGVYLAAEKRLMRVLEQIIVPEMLGRLSPTNP